MTAVVAVALGATVGTFVVGHRTAQTDAIDATAASVDGYTGTTAAQGAGAASAASVLPSTGTGAVGGPASSGPAARVLHQGFSPAQPADTSTALKPGAAQTAGSARTAGGAAPNAGTTGSAGSTPLSGAVQATGDSAAEATVLTLVNQERAKANCPALTVDARLTAAARAYSADMASRGFFAHTTPDGVDLGTRVTRAGYRFSAVGENIAKGQRDATAVMTAWMNSPGHRANILNCRFSNIGIGLARQGSTPLWTQDFGSPR
ncbi:CAP domain-containing protein [Planosporangium flavigriseum]|uniref:SCP domain-containing protein n=1 Tax=Planosporangium flavigriseum TaxID=373681 RepID=A0A8J3LZF1_9ACTN|nr:CAP domain-containing protein [Planosporangium flavigriseum]GIG76569.1 hypothetical protein Pfl04_49730 [Planosporangium flavigriseum]